MPIIYLCGILFNGKMRKKNFTLIELMIVILIIGTLAAMVIPRFIKRAEQAKIARAKLDINLNIATALDLYELDNGFYPTTEQGLNALLTKPTTPPIPPNWRGPYLKKKPIDPWGNPYVYICPGKHNPDSYDLYSYGKDGVEGGGDDITNWEE